VDAVIGAFRNFELNQLDIAGRPGRAFYPEELGVPAYDELILVANRARLKDPQLRRFVDALEKGVLYLQNHPEEGWALFLRNHKDLDDELNRRAWRDSLRRFTSSPGALDATRYERFARFLKERGVIKAVPSLATYAVELRP
jgi:putative hydroxymethylpyrimidine transport system substrate-binding protein